MKTVVITGSTQGLGNALAKQFLSSQCQVVINGRDEKKVEECCKLLRKEIPDAVVSGFACDVRDINALQELWDYAVSQYRVIDIWINNAGVSQPSKYLWELKQQEINQMIDVDLMSTIYGCKIAVNGMKKQGGGAIYNVEGFGSNDAFREKLSMYGTTKRAVTYFSDALAKELKQSKDEIIVGKISPGMIITDFLTKHLGSDTETQLTPQEKKIYNILGDYPETIAKYVVYKVLTNTTSGVRINWLTNAKIAKRFLLSRVHKRNFFPEK